jgi:hypothetical protein
LATWQLFVPKFDEWKILALWKIPDGDDGFQA